MRRLITSLLVVASLSMSGCSTAPAPTPAPTPSASSSVDAAAALRAAALPGPHEVFSASYELPDLPLRGLSESVEVVGHVVGPADVNRPVPLVVFLHGYTGSCWDPDSGDTLAEWPCPPGYEPLTNWLGFDYAQQRLASQGYLTVALSANGVNVLATQMGDDAGAKERALLVAHHLDAWADGSIPGMSDWPAADLDSVLLVGHSRGGEGVDATVARRPDSAAWTVAGEVLLAPTAFAPPATGTVPVVTLTGYCDGDVGPGAAQRYIDRPTEAALLRSAILLTGANHNFFNSQWGPGQTQPAGWGDDAFDESGQADPACQPDSPTRLDAAAQQEAAARVLGVTAAAFLRGDPAAADALDGRTTLPLETGTEVFVSAAGRHRTTVAPGQGLTASGVGGMSVTPCVGVSETEDPRDCGAFTGEGVSVHWPAVWRDPDPGQALVLDWTEPGSAAVLALDQPLDLSRAAGVEARIALDPVVSPVGFELTLTDTAGQSTTVPAGAPLAAFPQGERLPSRRWGQRLFAPLTGAGEVDLSSIESIAVAPSTSAGHAWLLDVSALPLNPGT